MKKKLGLLTLLGAASGQAVAQSNVTLYGLVDTNIEYVSNFSAIPPTQQGFPGPSRNRFAMASGGLSGSRWGLRGTEDLGDGMKSLFVLESGFSSDDGRMQQGGRLFGRQAYVGLQRNGIGTVTFGRQYTSIFNALSDFSPTKYGSQYEPLGLQLGLNYRSDNVVKYVGSFGGLTANAYWSFGNGAAGAGEVAGQFRRDTGYGGALSYAEGSFGATAVYDQYNPTLSATTGATGSFRKFAVAASYEAGPAKIMGGYRWGLNKSATDAILLRDDYYWVGINYKAASALTLTLGYYYDDVKNLAGTKVKNPWQLSFIADYAFSKRTDIYLTTAYARHSGLNFDTSAINFANGYYLAAGKNSMTGVAIGLRHRF
ncbi:hypothetical protein BKK79_22655 [Cupriavidus sp. USMAA2-4]|uniref:porin n=1 Tax=Cupriavidus sp. USMAA2-4 TaxID=876364 RepID=UPI0008A6F3F9|nr:porin [Cupriavidus sp. USMAA2-4]AOY94702.1 hypothetical protein BKK79_22655 [Cupriavidus sp. USMAA2-4]